MRSATATLLALALGVAVACTAASADTSRQIPSVDPTEPRFALGFKILADLVPDVVGQPLENEHWRANGDSLQRTTTGLMV